MAGLLRHSVRRHPGVPCSHRLRRLRRRVAGPDERRFPEELATARYFAILKWRSCGRWSRRRVSGWCWKPSLAGCRTSGVPPVTPCSAPRTRPRVRTRGAEDPGFVEWQPLQPADRVKTGSTLRVPYAGYLQRLRTAFDAQQPAWQQAQSLRYRVLGSESPAEGRAGPRPIPGLGDVRLLARHRRGPRLHPCGHSCTSGCSDEQVGEGRPRRACDATGAWAQGQERSRAVVRLPGVAVRWTHPTRTACCEAWPSPCRMTSHCCTGERCSAFYSTSTVVFVSWPYPRWVLR